MRVRYDSEADILYAEDGSVLEIEILDASRVVELKDFSFSVEEMLEGV